MSHSAHQIKKIARSIERKQNIRHEEALDIAAKQVGEASWADFRQTNKRPVFQVQQLVTAEECIAQQERNLYLKLRRDR